MTISVNCGACGKVYSLKPKTAGQTFACQLCGNQINIPDGNQLTPNSSHGGQPPTQDVPVRSVPHLSGGGISSDGKRGVHWKNVPLLVAIIIFGFCFCKLLFVDDVLERIHIANDPFPDAEYECYDCHWGLPDGYYKISENDECRHCGAYFGGPINWGNPDWAQHWPQPRR